MTAPAAPAGRTPGPTRPCELRGLLCHDGGMTDRLSATDASFLYAEDAGTPMHVGGVVILKPDADGPEFQYSEIVDLIESRLDLVPRYRQKVRFVPGRLARPVWVDDEDFDITYHVRRSAMPEARDRRRAGRAGRPADLPPAGSDPPAVGGLRHRGVDRRPDRPGQQDPPRDGRPDRCGRCGRRDPGRQPALAGSAGTAVDPEPVAQRHRPGRRRCRRPDQPAQSRCWTSPGSPRRTSAR